MCKKKLTTCVCKIYTDAPASPVQAVRFTIYDAVFPDVEISRPDKTLSGHKLFNTPGRPHPAVTTVTLQLLSSV